MRDIIKERIRGLREDADLRQSDVAKILHCSQNTYSDYENGKLDLSTQSLIALAELYNTSTDYLLGLTNIRCPYPKDK